MSVPALNVDQTPGGRRYMRLPGPWSLVMGGSLPEVTVAYETYGRLNAAGTNAVLVCHALTGDAHVAAHHPGDEPGWWEGLIGQDRPLDTRQWFVVCSNILGGCQGTTGPSSTDPATGRPYGLDFPLITVGDMVRVQQALLARLGVRHVALVTGGSLGGMQALTWVAQAPQQIGQALLFGSPWASSAQAIAWNEIGRHAILMDPAWQDGRYEPGQGPGQGLAIARMLAMISYRSWGDFNDRFGREPVPAGHDPVAARLGDYATRLPANHPFSMRFQMESYLHYQGDKLVQRFDARTYMYLTRAMDFFDCNQYGQEQWDRAVAAGVQVTAVGISSDLLYPAAEVADLARQLQQRGVSAAYRYLDSPQGHDAFLLEAETTGGWIREVLAREDS